jgi:hypothetical protein
MSNMKKYKENTNLFLQNRGFQPSFARVSLSAAKHVRVPPDTAIMNSIRFVLSWSDVTSTSYTSFLFI